MRINATTNLVYLPYLLKTGGINKRSFFQKLYDKGIENITNEELILLTLVVYATVCEENQTLDQLYNSISRNQHKIIQHIYYNLRCAYIPKHYAGALDYFLEMIFDSIKERNANITLRKIELKRKLASIGIYEKIAKLFHPTNKVSQDLFEIICNRLSSNYYMDFYKSEYTMADAMSAPHLKPGIPVIPALPAIQTKKEDIFEPDRPTEKKIITNVKIPANSTPSSISRTINGKILSMMKTPSFMKNASETAEAEVKEIQKEEEAIQKEINEDSEWYTLSPQQESEQVKEDNTITITTVVETNVSGSKKKKEKHGKK